MTVARHLRFEWLETSSVPTLEHMKTGRLFYAAILATGMIASPVKADTAVSVDFFYEHLEPHGSWFEMDDYGYVWQPYGPGSSLRRTQWRRPTIVNMGHDQDPDPKTYKVG